jgi:glutamate 5-kinase
MEVLEQRGAFDRASVLSRKSRRIGRMEIEGRPVYFQSLSDAELSDYEQAMFTTDDETGKIKIDEEAERTARARLLQSALVDAQGNLLFSQADVANLCELDSEFVLPVVAAIRDHCGITDAVARRKTRDTLKKN